MSISPPALDIFIFFLALVPGYIFVKTARLTGDITTPFDRFEKTIWSFIGSAISISVLFFAYTTALSLHHEGLLLPNLLIDIELVILSFPILVVIGAGIGLVTGKTVSRFEIGRLSRDLSEPTWDYLTHRINDTDEPIEVRVNTDGGMEIRGYIGAMGTTNDSRDLLLVYPERLHRIDEEISSKVSDGEFFYIKEDAINSISFELDIDDLQLSGTVDG